MRGIKGNSLWQLFKGYFLGNVNILFGSPMVFVVPFEDAIPETDT